MPADTPPPHLVTCPGCARPLHVPPDAVGKPGHCPHCRTNFFLPANPDGSPGEPTVSATAPTRFGVPKALLGPGFALLIIGAVGAFVNGYLLLRFLTVPGSDVAYARSQIQEMRNLEGMRRVPAAAKAKAEPPPPPEDTAEADEALAQSWAPGMVPVHAVSLVLSALTAAGGAATLTGRLYPLALLGCAAAAVNVNNLCCLPGGAAGLWGLLMLVRDENRRHFGKG